MESRYNSIEREPIAPPTNASNNKEFGAAHLKVDQEPALRPISTKNRLPFWTWILPFFLFHLAGILSENVTTASGGLVIYLPVSVSIIIVQWWGPRILPALYLAALSRSILLKGEYSYDFLFVKLINDTHVPVTTLLSWWLFRAVGKGKSWLPDKESVMKFLGLAVLLPVSVNACYEFVLHNASELSIGETIFYIWTADFASTCALALPTLYFLTPWMEKINLTLQTGSRIMSVKEGLAYLRQNVAEIVSLLFSIVMLSSFLHMGKYWFVLGVFVVFISIRFGFAYAVISNLLVFILSYIKPFLMQTQSVDWGMLEIHQGMCLLGLAASITGRVVSDLRKTDRKLMQQFEELKQAHAELDRFVYSTSHDLSAPLKTIRGLINISRVEKEEYEKKMHLDRMERSILKLERFIHEIQEYARNKRLEVIHEKLTLEELIDETLENLQHIENFEKIKIHRTDLKITTFYADRMRVKIILNNLISNAIQYHRVDNTLKPHITIRSESHGPHILIHVEDNGEGIREDLAEHVFKMFYRGSLNSNGAGLGLYIAREAADKMGGKISVQSIYGLGSIFTLLLPRNSVVMDK